MSPENILFNLVTGESLGPAETGFPLLVQVQSHPQAHARKNF
jgi:hypothetical protein